MHRPLRITYASQIAVTLLILGCGGGGGSGGQVNPPPPPPANVAPTADVTAPSDLGVYVVGDSIQFVGTGADTEDGALSGGSLVWESDIDGEIGTGTDFNSTTLSAGTHQITVTVTDSSGGTDTATTLIRVSIEQLETYPSADPSRQSELYRVEVEQAGAWVDTQAYQYSRQSRDPSWHTDLFPWVHWTTVGVSQGAQVNVRVTRLNRPSGNDPFSSVELLPSRYNKSPVWDNDTITFAIKQSQKVYVRTNDQDLDTLFINAIPLKPPVPIGAKYFGQGVHNIGLDYVLLPSEQDVYLDGGAWVIGSLHTNDIAGDLRIMGPGVLSGEFEVWENVFPSLPFEETNPYMMIHTEFGGICPTFDVQIQGITIVASPFHNVHFGCLNGAKAIDNLHIISPWTITTDGLNVGNKGHTTNTFIFNNDHTIAAEYLEDGDMTVSDSVFAAGQTFAIGIGFFPSGDPYQANISDIDLILQHFWGPFSASIDGFSPDMVVDNQNYTNITIDGDVEQLIRMVFEELPWGSPDPAQGNIRDLTFTNITVTGSQNQKSVIRGKDANNRIDNIQFTNLSIGGTVVTNSNRDQFFDIDDDTVTVDFSP